MEAKGGVFLAQVCGVVGEVEIGDNLEGGLAELIDTAPKGECFYLFPLRYVFATMSSDGFKKSKKRTLPAIEKGCE